MHRGIRVLRNVHGQVQLIRVIDGVQRGQENCLNREQAHINNVSKTTGRNIMSIFVCILNSDDHSFSRWSSMDNIILTSIYLIWL